MPVISATQVAESGHPGHAAGAEPAEGGYACTLGGPRVRHDVMSDH